MFIAIMLLAWVVTKAITDGRIDHTYAKQGLVSPRLEAKYGSKQAARDETARYGFVDYAKDAYSDHWQRRAAVLAADRDAFVADPSMRVPLRQRWVNAKRAMNVAYRKVVDPVPVAADRPAATQTPKPVVTPLVESGDVLVGTVRHTDRGQEKWDGTGWRLLPDASASIFAPPPSPAAQTGAVVPADRTAMATDQPKPDQTATTGGTPMTAPTGEAVNYETTVAELEALAREQRGHLDHCAAALRSINDAKGSINDMQESYRASAAAAALTSEHLAAKNLDGVTLANAGTTADAMPAGVVDAMYDQLEAMEEQAKARLADAEVALGATETNLAHVQATYGDAHATVAGNLSGDASFLDSAGGAPVGGGNATGGGREQQPTSAGGVGARAGTGDTADSMEFGRRTGGGASNGGTPSGAGDGATGSRTQTVTIGSMRAGSVSTGDNSPTTGSLTASD